MASNMLGIIFRADAPRDSSTCAARAPMAQCHLAWVDHAASPSGRRLASLIAAGVAGAVVAGPFHPVGVVAGSLDDAGVGSVPPLRVEVLFPGDAGHDGREDAFLPFRGERPPGQRPGGGQGGRCA
jgi:hypothetical protein